MTGAQDELVDLAEYVKELERERDALAKYNKKVEQVEFQRDALVEVVKDASKRQRQCLEIMRKNNLVLDNLDDPMQKLAFTFYTELVAIAMQADNALAML